MYSNYFPSVNYGGGIAGSSSFRQTELESVYGQSYDLTSLSKAAFKQYMDAATHTMDKFNSRVGVLEVQADRMREDLLNAPSVVQHQVRQALDRNLQTQAALGATLMGPVGKVNDFLMNKNVREAHSISISAIGAHIQEDIARKSLYYQELDKNNKNIIASLGGMSQAQMQGLSVTGDMARGGLTTALGAASTLAGNRLQAMQLDIQEREMGLNWEKALLESETSMYSDNMSYKGGIERAVTQAEAMNYGSWLDARVRSYDSMNRAKMHAYQTEMSGAVEVYKTNIESTDMRWKEQQHAALDVEQMRQDMIAKEMGVQSNIAQAAMGRTFDVLGGNIPQGDPNIAGLKASKHWGDPGGHVDKMFSTFYNMGIKKIFGG